MPVNTLPVDSNSKPAIGGFDPTTQHVAAVKLGTIATSANGTEYAPAIVNLADPVTPSNQLSINNLGQIAISNFPPTQSVIGTVDINDRSARLLGHVTVDAGGIGTTSIPSYSVLQDPTTNANKLKINSDGSINVSAGTGNFTVVGAGTAGTPVGGVVTIQGVTNGTPIPISGSITASNPSVSTTSSAIPGSATFLGASDGTNLQGLLVESSSNKNLRIAIYNGGTEATVTGSNALKVDGSAVTQPVSGTITANIGTTNGLALDTSVNGILVSQGSTTSGEKGPLIQGAVSTSAPSYTTAQTSPLSLTTAGALRVDASATTQPVSGTITANAGTNLNTSALALETGGNLATIAGAVSSSKMQDNLAQVGGSAITLGSKVSASSVPVVIASDQAAIAVQHGNAVDANNSSTSTLTANSVFTGTGTSSLNYSALSLEVFADQASAAGGLSVQQSQDNSHWDIADTFSVSASTAFNTIVNLIGQYYRVVYTNGGTNQGAFRLQTVKMVADPVLPRTLTSAGALRVDGSSVTQPVSGTVSITSNSAVNVAQVAGTTTDTNSGNKSAGTLRVVIATDQPSLSNALKVDGSAVTQPVSGTVTANQGGANWSINIAQVAGGATSNAGQTGAIQVGGAVATNNNVSSATNPLLIAGSDYGGTPKVQSLKVDGSGNAQVAVTNTPTVTANAGTNLNTSALALDTSVNGLLVSQGSTTSGEKGPLIQGAVTTNAPSYMTAQTSPLSLDTSGLLRASLKDTPSNTNNLNVNIAASAATVTVSGTVTANQGGSNWSTNVAQFGGTNVVTGTGASGNGIPRLTVSNDSQIQMWDGTTGPTAVKAANTSPTLTDKSLVQTLSPNNTGLPVNLPVIVQSTNNKSSGSVASLAKAFTSNNTQGNSIVVVCGVGNGTAPTISDTNSNTYTQAAQVANGTAFNVAVFYAVGIASGANTVTVNNGGTTASIAMEIYEVSGLLASVPNQPDQTATNTGSSGTASTSAMSALSPNEYAFAGVGVGTAAQTITVGSGWTNDSGQQNPTTPAGLFSFVSMSQFLGSLKAVTPQATFTSEPWSMAVATFRPVILGIEGSVNLTQIGGVAYSQQPPGAAAPGQAPYMQILLQRSGVTFSNMCDPNYLGITGASGYGLVANIPYSYNGSTYDGLCGNQDNITLSASSAKSSNGNSSDQTNYNARGVRIWITTGSFGASESTMTVSLQGKDPVSGNYFTLATSGSLTASGTFQIVCYPGASNSGISTPSIIVGDVLPRTWRVTWSASNWGTGGSTVGIAASLIV